MRPLLLQVTGFTAFRTEQTLDLRGLDLFAIAGPTGAGKSSLLDAMTYALYGEVERVGNEVSQLISQGLPGMAVTLEFALGERVFRVGRRTPRRSAATAILEERLGNEWTSIADKSREVNAAVRRLIGLDYAAFTRAVVLPQGRFDQFLKGDAKRRRDILTELLDLGLFDRMAKHANERARDARAEAELKRDTVIREYGDATAKRLATERDRAKAAQERETTLRDAELLVRGVAERERAHAAEVATRRTLATEVATAARVFRTAADRLEAFAENERAAAAAAAAAERSARDALTAATKATKERTAAEARWGTLATVAGTRGRAERLAELRVAAHEAEHVATNTKELRKGDPCPVCGVPLTAAPKGTAATREATAARRAATTARAAVAAAEEALATAFGGSLPRDPLAELDERIGRLETLVTAERAAAVVASAAQSRAARVVAERAKAEGATLVERERSAPERATALHARCVTLAASALPALPRAPRSGTLAAHATYARAAADVLDTCAKSITPKNTAGAFLAEARAVAGAFVADSQAITAADFAEDLATEAREAQRTVATAAAAAETIAKGIARRETLEVEARDLDRVAARHHALATDLKADRIVDFLQGEALRLLAQAGSTHLARLSDGRYRLAFRDDEFVVVDVWNGEEERSVRTLSGGETFLASLALAVALADEVRTLAVTERARLDSLFLDEGFGALDAETLGQAVAALDRLGDDGRMVGVITHVREMAEQFPRIEVLKSPSGSRLERAS